MCSTIDFRLVEGVLDRLHLHFHLVGRQHRYLLHLQMVEKLGDDKRTSGESSHYHRGH